MDNTNLKATLGLLDESVQEPVQTVQTTIEPTVEPLKEEAVAETETVEPADGSATQKPKRKRATQAEMEARIIAERNAIIAEALASGEVIRPGEQAAAANPSPTESENPSPAKRLSVMQVVKKIQMTINCPKDLSAQGRNGQYPYRSVESILKSIKPMLDAHDCTLLFTRDELDVIGQVQNGNSNTFLPLLRRTVAADILDTVTGERVSFGPVSIHESTNDTRESDPFLRMSHMQISGSASTYAKKILLQDIFLFDDSRVEEFVDPDFKETATQAPSKPAAKQSAIATEPMEKPSPIQANIISSFEMVAGEEPNNATHLINRS